MSATKLIHIGSVPIIVGKNELEMGEGRAWVIPALGPEIAEQLLQQLHPGQRSIRIAHVGGIARAMENGKFRWIGDPLRVDAIGQVIDGQHRLAAVVKSGCTLRDVLLVQIKAEDALGHIDVDLKPRSLHEGRTMMGKKVVHTQIIAAIVYEFCDFNPGAINLLSKSERIELVDTFEFHEELTKLHNAGRVLRIKSGALAGAIRCIRKDKADAVKFFSAAFANKHHFGDEKEVSTLVVLANFLLSTQVGKTRQVTVGNDMRSEEAEKTIRAWNAWRSGQKLAKLQRGYTGRMPQAM
jgi:hypothetical protein